MLSNGNEDGAFDHDLDSEGRITNRGYQVEIAVPFASLRLPDRENQTWRVNFWRDHQRDVRRRYAWAAQDRGNPCFMCQWGTLTGLDGIVTGNNFETIVSGIASQVGAGDPDTDFENEDPEADVSAQVKYALSSAAYAELRSTRDFSQESDEGQIDVNTTFALFFRERRPFFQEGSDLLGSWINAIYTRSINDPRRGGRSSRGSSTRPASVYAAAQDAHSPIIIPLEERSHFLLGEKSFSNIPASDDR